MKEEYFKEYSRTLDRDMEFKVYGHTGKPVLVFPPGSGRFWHYEFHGMVEICRPYIDAGRIQLFCIDGIDFETWDFKDGNPYDRIRLHERYFNYVTDEFIPRIKGISRDANGGREIGILATGCSMGAFHSALTYFRRPDLLDSVIALSGLYSSKYFMGDYMDEVVYFNSVLNFLFYGTLLCKERCCFRYHRKQVLRLLRQSYRFQVRYNQIRLRFLCRSSLLCNK